MRQRATFAAGCFWGDRVGVPGDLPGVIATRVGYTGGHTENPTYQEVCGHRTGHAEAVEVEFDPEQVSYEQLLDVFWTKHNPRSRNRQGFDIGSQHRSAIFYHSTDQEEAARRTKDALVERFPELARRRRSTRRRCRAGWCSRSPRARR